MNSNFLEIADGQWPNVTAQEIGYIISVEVDPELSRLESMQTKTNRELARAHLEDLAGLPDSVERLEAARTRLENASGKLQALKGSRQTLMQMLGDALLSEAQAALSALPDEYESLVNEKTVSMKAILVLGARLLIRIEEVRGRAWFFAGERKGMIEKPAELSISSASLSVEEYGFFLTEVDKLRKGSPVKNHADCLDEKMAIISKEISRLEALVSNFDPLAEAEKYLQSMKTAAEMPAIRDAESRPSPFFEDAQEPSD